MLEAKHVIGWWKQTLWRVLGITAGAAAVIVLLSAWLNFVFVLGIAFGLAVFLFPLLLASETMRVEAGQPVGDFRRPALFPFPLRRAGAYPQYWLMALLGATTIALSILVAGLGGDGADDGGRRAGGHKPGDKIDPPDKPKTEEGSAEPGLRAHFTFDEGKGDTTVDTGPHRLVAKLHGCTWAPGVRGKALQFDGVKSYVDLGSARELTFAARTPLTVAAWFKTSGAQGVILSCRPGPETHDMINVALGGGKLVVLIREHGNPFHPGTTNSTMAVNDDKWRHFAVTRSPTGEIKLYVDGVLNATMAGGFHGPQLGKIITHTRILGVESSVITGRDHPMLDRSRFEGLLDELQFFGDALGEKEIQKLIAPG
jgi:hypothetical protein